MKKLLIGAVASYILSACTKAPEPPAPYGANPTPEQIEWQKMEYYMFIHFGPNTFTDKEWGHGDENPKLFNPTNLDCRQWAKIAKDAGMKAIIITAKHHDGFCLWPSEYSTHTVRESAWKDGKGDIIRELSDACKEYGLKFGVYLSPWDRNHPAYGTPEYNQIFANTLKEVLGNYGPVFEQWFDGACGEGPNGKRQEYDWDLFHKTVYDLQPHAIIFSDIGPGCRWMGNEKGVGGLTNWSTLNVSGFGVGLAAPSAEVLNSGNMNGEKWVPAEVDVSIRPGWFYSASTDDKVKSVGKLTEIYYTSVGRNCNLLLNVPPDRRGLIHPNDSARLMEFRKVIDESFNVNLALKAKVIASYVRGNADKYNEKQLLDGNYDSYWTTDDNQHTASIEIVLDKEQSFNRFVLQEYIPLGQRVKLFSVEYWDQNEWKTIDQQTTIGYKRILCFPLITTKKIRLHIEDALACPVLSEIGIFRAPEILESPVIARNSEGKIRITTESADPVIYYTTDGSEPTPASSHYTQPFDMPDGGTVKAKAFIDNNKKSTDAISITLGISPVEWKTDGPAESVIDGNYNSYYSGTGPVTVNLSGTVRISGFAYIPMPGANNIYEYNFYASADGKKWQKIKTNATFANIKNNPVPQYVSFDAPVDAGYIRVEPLSGIDSGKKEIAIAEIEIFKSK